MIWMVNTVVGCVGVVGFLVNTFICYKLVFVKHRKTIFDTGKAETIAERSWTEWLNLKGAFAFSRGTLILILSVIT